jgi:beta-lactam-binding protein with PASTA domain/predicted Ser/Thr protein kinase
MADDDPKVYGGRYHLHRRVARGGMADVYLARDSLLDRPVALKVLFPEFATDPSFVERFRREAQAAAGLNHPAIVSVYDWGEEDGTYFIVMEYLEGRSLSQIIRDEGALLPDRAADVAIDIAAALGFAHRGGVIHRDVKPGNVLISPVGQVKVTDFGIARAVSTQENLTQTGTVMGTATYFSPEQARGENVDPRSDVYSLGVVLYEMLTGSPPFSGDNPVSVAYKHVQEQPDLPRARNPQVPVALEAVTMKALAKNPANRYASADELAADLRRFREGQPVHAETILSVDEPTRAVDPATVATRRVSDTRALPRTPGAPAEQAWDDTRRSPLFVALVAVLIVVLLGILALVARSAMDSGGETLAVPNVVDLPQDEAQRTLQDAGFDVTTDQDRDDDKEEGVVLRQDPAAGSELEAGKAVTIVVNSSAPRVEVPDVVGEQEADATRMLTDLNLKAQAEPQVSDAPIGEVLSQSPPAGEAVPRGSVVRLTVSSGAGTGEVPDVVGLDRTAAANELGRAGFKSDAQDEASDTVEEGTVIRTDPEAGTALEKGETVVIYVSSGPASSIVPNVVGLTAEEATARLEGDGFSVIRRNRVTVDPAENGVVVDQSPGAGEDAAPGDPVTIEVGRFVGSSTSSTTTTTTTTTTTP